MNTFFHNLLLIIIFIFGAAEMIIAQEIRPNQDPGTSNNESYTFDFKIHPNSTYQLSSNVNRESVSLNEKENEKDAGLLNDMMEGTIKVANYELLTIKTESIIDDKLSVSVSFDSIHAEMESDKMGDMLQNLGIDQSELNRQQLELKIFAHSEDFKEVKIDSFIEAKLSEEKTGLSAILSKLPAENIANTSANEWNLQSTYPKGAMAIGDTFIYLRPPQVISKVDTTITVEQQSEHETFYVLKNVEEEVAYFDVSLDFQNEISVGSDKINAKGTLEYNLKDDYFQKLEIISHHQSKLNFNDQISHSEHHEQRNYTITKK